MRPVLLILFTLLVAAAAPPAGFAKTGQVPGVDPDPALDLPGSSWQRYDPDLQPPALDSGPYDPLGKLGSPLEVTRAEAASYIGWARRFDCADALVAFLSGRTGNGADVLAALWALGQVGSAAALPCLSQWAREGPVEARIEALRSLADLKLPQALPAFVEGFARRPGPSEDPVRVRAEHRICFESLAAQGDASCLPLLRRLAPQAGLRDAWSDLNAGHGDAGSRGREREIIALLAACGDGGAIETIADAVIAGSGVTSPAALLREAAQGGSLDGFPWGFWIGRSLLVDNPPRPAAWPAFSAAIDLLKSRPPALDAILREAAGSRKVPDGGKVLLVGCLSRETPADIAILEGIWTRALGTGAVRAVLPVNGPGNRLARLPYNLNASAVVYALGRLRRDDVLARLWNECPDREPTLQGDMALALARVGSRRAAPLVEAYVSRQWNRAARLPDFEERARAAGLDEVSSVLGEESNPFDLPYRSREITRFLLTYGDRGLLERLVLDPSLHPCLRLYWIQRLVEAGREPWMAEVAGQALDRLESETVGEAPLVAALRSWTRRTIRSHLEEMKPEPYSTP